MMNRRDFLRISTAALFLFIINRHASAQIGQVVQTFPGPHQHPAGLTFDGQYLWVSDLTSERIYKIEPATGNVFLSFPSPGSAPTGLTWDGQNLWCGDNDLDKIYKINPADGSVLQTIAISTPAPRGLAFVNGSVYYQDSRAEKIFQLNPVTGEVVSQFAAPGEYGRGLTWDGNSFWSTDRFKNEYYRLDSLRKKVVDIIPAPGTYSYGLAWDGTYLWNADYETNKIYKIQVRGDELFVRSNPRTIRILYTVETKNTGSTTMNLKSYFAVPTATPFQELLNNIRYYPAPTSFLTDNFQRPVAYYTQSILPGSSTFYRWEVDAKTYNARFYYLSERVGKLQEIPADIKAKYTVDGSKYDIHNSVITSALTEAVQGETGLYWMVRNIHDYIISHIEYINDHVWSDAPQVLTQGHGSCSEYSMTFISMCRAAGIPACSEAGGHIRAQLPYEDTVFHRWAYIYFPQVGWTPVDCTWDDRDNPADQARYFGGYSGDVFATTRNGGDSNYLGWTYNVAQSSSGGKRSRTKKMEFFQSTVSVAVTDLPETGEQTNTLVNYPNPFNEETQIMLQNPRAGFFSIAVYDLLGRQVAVLFQGELSSGNHSFVWDGKDSNGNVLPSGVYFLIAGTKAEKSGVRMLLLR